MRKKIYRKIAGFWLAALCAFVGIQTDGLSEGFTAYAEEIKEPIQEADDVYLDTANNVSYYYYGYSDGTAIIYDITFADRAIIDIPSNINGYSVTQISIPKKGTNTNHKIITTLTIPETITYIEKEAFSYCDIETLNYNTNASNGGNILGWIFEGSKISNLNIGSNVTIIADYTFAGATFDFSEFELSVATIGNEAFREVWKNNPVKLTLTEKVTNLGQNAFLLNSFVELNYNANAQTTAKYTVDGAFYKSTIHALNIGDNVTTIPDFTFYKSKFTFAELKLNVESIGEDAFASIYGTDIIDLKCSLTLTDRVHYIKPSAFANNYFKIVNYNANADGESVYNAQGIFYQSYVEELNIGENVIKLPEWLFYKSYFQFDELNLKVQKIGEHAFSYVWEDASIPAKLTLSEDITFIGPSAFCGNYFSEVNYNCNADGESEYNTESIFRKSYIPILNIGENVTKIPAWAFYQAYFEFSDFTINVETIGEHAFSYAWTSNMPVDLTVGERVTSIDKCGFGDLYINHLQYNANATMPCSYYGAFEDSVISSLDIGENITKIGNYIFKSADFQFTDLIINAEIIQEHAFQYAWNMDSYPANLIFGEKIKEFGKKSFADNYVNSITYLSTNAIMNDISSKEYAPFSDCKGGSVSIGSSVVKIPKWLFYGLSITQESFVIPDSVEEIGEDIFSSDKVNITNLYIGSGLKDIKSSSLGNALSVTNAYVNVVKGNEVFLSTSINTAKNNLPIAENVYIHLNSDFYRFFTTKATTIHPYCIEHMKESIGEQYFDSQLLQYVTPIFNICEICNYQTTTTIYEDVHTVLFYVDEKLYHTAYVKDGENVIIPENPIKDGYHFMGWDKEMSNIKENMTVHAEFEIKKYTVTFKDYDGSILETQVVEHGGNVVPKEPVRKGYTFIGWDENHYNITKDMVITAKYKMNTYTVTFADYDGKILDTQTIKYGSNATPPKEPIRKGYDFVGWDKNYVNITEDKTIKANYLIKIFSVIFKDLDNIVSEQQVEYGKSAKEPTVPTRANEMWGSWIFTKWDADWSNIIKDTQINAVFEKKYNEYIVIFVDYDGSVIATQNVMHGKSAIAPENPIREGYTFQKWDRDYSNITSHTMIYAVYEKGHEHTFNVISEKKEANCIGTGYVITTCFCGEISRTDIPINFSNHVGEIEIKGKKESSCMENGYTGDSYCKSCTALLEQGRSIEKKEHVPGQDVIENKVEATVEMMGYYDVVVYCEICNTELSRNRREIPKLLPDTLEDVIDPEEPSESEEPNDTQNPIESENSSEIKEPDNTENQNETEKPSNLKESNKSETYTKPKKFPIVPIAVGVATSSTGIIYFLYWKCRKKIFGTVLDKTGNTVTNAKIYLDGMCVLETITDANGYFEFKNLKNGDYQFILCNEFDVMLMEANVHMKEKDIKQVVDIVQSSCDVSAKHISKNISLIITIH